MFTVTNNPDKVPTLEQLQNFYDLCSKHDWYYDYSDDHRVWSRGNSEYDKLKTVGALHPKYQEMFVAWSKYVFSGNHFGTEKPPKPSRPE